jgi:hypothetical protein
MSSFASEEGDAASEPASMPALNTTSVLDVLELETERLKLRVAQALTGLQTEAYSKLQAQLSLAGKDYRSQLVERDERVRALEAQAKGQAAKIESAVLKMLNIAGKSGGECCVPSETRPRVPLSKRHRLCLRAVRSRLKPSLVLCSEPPPPVQSGTTSSTDCVSAAPSGGAGCATCSSRGASGCTPACPRLTSARR